MSSAMLAAMSDATSVFMSSMVEHVALSVMKIILFVTFIFIIENGFGLGFGALEHSMTVSKCHGSNNQ